ncbi:coenzyme F420-0:L-glutamate ligase [Pseudactinotalea sp. HY158]|uniref:coenzyme F420-0:L-glutamate ligase n=1 Tax=Pseudactinotalea sp. HY158 TaxID=2654547 RepID=UPI00129CAB7A|nr:coenzyme F420-0:L-glutamate ligase [Pseudactinotalea sp. HY158]QGH71048.1 coenzyme F420-0:L-glutamate ligase [Pseudactinotalea sp. HY158]
MLLAQAPDGLPVFTSGDDVAALLTPALATLTWPDGSSGLRDGDVVVVASKIIARAEGRLIAAKDREEAIDAESVREVARREYPDGTVLRIVETRHGFVTAAAGIDTSNVPAGTALLLPQDPDASARRLRRGLRARLDLRLGVLVTDTVGRPWRRGAADIAIGAAGIDVLDDLRGQVDLQGRELRATVMAVGDEIAAAAELVRGKTTGRPVAVVRGLHSHVIEDDGPGATAAVRTADEDLFRRGVSGAD